MLPSTGLPEDDVCQYPRGRDHKPTTWLKGQGRVEDRLGLVVRDDPPEAGRPQAGTEEPASHREQRLALLELVDSIVRKRAGTEGLAIGEQEATVVATDPKGELESTGQGFYKLPDVPRSF